MSIIKNLIEAVTHKPSEEEFNDFIKNREQPSPAPAKMSPERTAKFPVDKPVEISRPGSLHESSYSKTYIREKDKQKILNITNVQGSKEYILQTTAGGKSVCILKPREYADAADVCDALLSNCCVILCLTEVDSHLGQRIIDFISGAVYSIDGRLCCFQTNIFLVTPDDYDISGDYEEILEDTGFDMLQKRTM